MRIKFQISLGFLLTCLVGASQSLAQLPSNVPANVPVDTSVIQSQLTSQLTNLLENDPTYQAQVAKVSTMSKAFIKFLGLAAIHRPYQPATGLGADFGLDMGLDVTMVHLPDFLIDALKTGGLSDPRSTLPAVPVPRLQLHKGLKGGIIDLGGSYLGYKFAKMYGYDVKIAFWSPDEGPTFAFRYSYSKNDLTLIKTTSHAGELIMSKKLVIFDPYIGVGYIKTSGTLGLSVSLPAPFSSVSLGFSFAESARAWYWFSGLPILVWPIGLKIGIEGGYHSLGMHYMGLKLGIEF